MAEGNQQKKIFLHLLGKTGAGRSSLGNTLLGKRVFDARSSVSSVTKTIQKAETQIGKYEAVVVDGPCLVAIDKGFSADALASFQQVMKDNKDSNHVLLMVCRYGELFTDDDKRMVTELSNKLGKQVFHRSGIVLVTCGDNFAADTEGEETTFKDWCQEQIGTFADLCKRCKDRVELVDNRKANTQDLHKTLEPLLIKCSEELECTGEETNKSFFILSIAIGVTALIIYNIWFPKFSMPL